MSSLLERVEGLVAKWRSSGGPACFLCRQMPQFAIAGTGVKANIEVKTTFCSEHEARHKDADELTAALAAEGQGDAWLDPKSLGIPLQHEPRAAAPSLHKEPRCNVGHPLRSDWRCDLPSTHGDEPHHYSEMDVPAALHKEGAGGAAAIRNATIEEIASFAETHYCIIDANSLGGYKTCERPKHPNEPFARAIRALMDCTGGLAASPAGRAIEKGSDK